MEATQPQAKQAMAGTAATAHQERVETVAEAATVELAMVGTVVTGVIVPPEKEEMEGMAGTAEEVAARVGKEALAPKVEEAVEGMGELDDKQ